MDCSPRVVLALARTAAGLLVACLICRGVTAVVDAFTFRAGALVSVYAGVIMLLASSWFGLERSLPRQGFQSSRGGAAILMLACSGALALGNAPGLFLSSLGRATALLVSVAAVAGLASGPLRTSAPRIWSVVFFAAAGAAWQVGAAPLLATLLVQN